MLGGGSSPPRPVHPVLSSLFRVTDGVRMATHAMLFLSDERTRLPGEPITAAELYGFAERNGLFLSGTGVCAGPQALINEFLDTIFDGKAVEGVELAPDVRNILSLMPVAVDYGLLGLAVWAVSRTAWLAMSRAYKTLRVVFESLAVDAGLGDRLRARLGDDWRKLDQARIATDYERDVHLQVYVDTYEQAWRALRSPSGPATLAERIAPGPEGPAHVAAGRRLRDLLGSRLSGIDFKGVAGVDQIVDALVRYLREEQAILASTAELQVTINALLDRAPATRPLTVRDLRVNQAMYGGSIAEFPYLFDMLEDEIAVRVDCNASSIEVSDSRAGPA
jgi:hypothetical protein